MHLILDAGCGEVLKEESEKPGSPLHGYGMRPISYLWWSWPMKNFHRVAPQMLPTVSEYCVIFCWLTCGYSAMRY